MTRSFNVIDTVHAGCYWNDQQPSPPWHLFPTPLQSVTLMYNSDRFLNTNAISDRRCGLLRICVAAWLPAAVATLLENLEISQTYHYRVAASNEFGDSHGENRNFTTTPFSMSGISLQPFERSFVDWGDVNADDHMDLVLVGLGENSMGAGTIYVNNQAGNLFPSGLVFHGVWAGQTKWGDYNNDNVPDLAVIGVQTSGSQSAHIYHNVAGNALISIATIGASGQSGAAWGDADNDGDLDVFVTSRSAATRLGWQSANRTPSMPVWISIRLGATPMRITWSFRRKSEGVRSAIVKPNWRRAATNRAAFDSFTATQTSRSWVARG